MKTLELKIPPVAVFIFLLLLSYGFSQHAEFGYVKLPFTTSLLIVGTVISVVIGLSGVWEFRKHKTTVNPTKPDGASTIVDSGVYGYTRNPMYLGLFILLFSLGYYFQNLVSISFSFLFVIYMNQFQIKAEEKILEQLFGASYVDYQQKVRRWI
ncbi:isoprenylcysteine carboxylmethyltransferase family protein [Vibrio sp. 99-70-13A1]|uniref:methyltransferase family protein n=1 Tax=Vibrio sp. 99-70-13A1 TaxID=2607601 RepID=UPI00149372E2|nr:isoprenylcysteine carboxylmethyltransferase family protein [Vibrio sp. 99-70-13A1]NOH97913.1 isoprenylcysteine carboxylmethyltransferase family protein [Vibrio sp. 99-70-13A1]